jgi:hypothetical protein
MRVSAQYAASFLERNFDPELGFQCQLSSERNFRESRPGPREVFSIMLCHHLLDPDLFSTSHRRQAGAFMRSQMGAGGLVEFFSERGKIPPDTDCSAVCIHALRRIGEISEEDYARTLSSILGNTQADGIVQVYRDPQGARDGLLDPVVGTNVLLAANAVGRACEAAATETFVARALLERSYLSGSRYYQSPETFLCLLATLIAEYPERYAALRPALVHELKSRAGIRGLAIETYQLALAYFKLGVEDSWAEGIAQQLPDVQLRDGSFTSEALFRYGRTEVYFGSPALSTQFALALIEAAVSKQAAPTHSLVAPRNHASAHLDQAANGGKAPAQEISFG